MIIGIPTVCLEDLVSKDYIDIVYKKAKHTLNVCFSVLVRAIRMVSHKNMYLVFQSLEVCISGCRFCIYNLKKPRF